MLGFVIIFHPRRINNLQQTLRLLERRESLDAELVLVCQTRCEPIPNNFSHYQHLNLDLDTYWKARMTNCGVEIAKSDTLVLLDSDRILPPGYFAHVSLLMEPGRVITTRNLYRLLKPYSDAEIESDQIEKTVDFRSTTNETWQRNLFSGNTMIRKDDYLGLGGYDESYIGYGFADNDMTRKARDMDIVFLEEKEYHLYHELTFDLNGREIDSGVDKRLLVLNMLRYCLKWKVWPNEYAQRYLSEGQMDQLRRKMQYL